jgi:16S rRNA processing protein RimM
MAEHGALWACGTLGRAHGLHGEMYVNLAPGGLEYLQEGERFYVNEEGADAPRPVELQFAGGTDRRPLVRVSAAGSRDAAAALTGATLYAAGGDLDQRPFYRVSELIGLRAVCGGRELGIVTDVISAPANDVLEVTADDGQRLLLPLKDEIVTVDQAAGVATVIEGFL